MQADQPLDQGQAKSRAVELPRIVVVDLRERLAQARKVVLGDADAVVDHRQLDHRTRSISRGC